MSFPFRLTAWGWGKVIGYTSIAAVVGLHSLAEKVGLIDDTPVAAAPTPAEQQSLAERDAEVKRLIAVREAQAKAIKAADGAGY